MKPYNSILSKAILSRKSGIGGSACWWFPGWIPLIFVFCFGVPPTGFAETGPAEGPVEKQPYPKIGAKSDEVLTQNHLLLKRMMDARKTLWNRFYHPKTSQFYTVEPARLPCAEKVKRLDPNDCGYGTGMDDCPLFGGILLVAICDQYKVTGDNSLKKDARAVFQGLALCATAHGIPGFVARGVCPEDGKSVYITSSRDQYTHLVHGFWHYYHSPLCDEEAKREIREILQAVADRMTRNVTPENNYDFLRADGTQDHRGICRMLDVSPHEAARLAMFYAAAWDVGREEEHYRLYRKHLPRAIEESLELPNRSRSVIVTTAYAVLQMQCSLEVLHDLEPEGEMKSRIGETMFMVARFAVKKGKPDCRKMGGFGNPCGELALAKLMSKDFSFTKQHETRLAEAIIEADYENDPSAAYCHLGAYWKARANGVFGKEN